MFLGPAMFDEVPCEMHLARVTPPLLGLSEVTTDRAVSHTFLHSPWNTAVSNLSLTLFSSQFLSLHAQIYLLSFSPIYRLL